MQIKRVTMLVCGWVAALAVALSGCDKPNPPPPEESEQSGIRIVSLAPAITQMLIDLGFGDNIVGISSHDSASPSNQLPVVGNYQEIDTEAVLKLKPTHVLMMTGAEGVPERMRQLASSSRFFLASYPSPLSITQVGQIVFDEQELLADSKRAPGQMPSLGVVLDAQAQATHVKYNMLRRLAAIDHAVSGEAKPSVLMVIGLKPVMASGPETVHDELLTAFAGGINAAGESKVGAPTFDREALIAMAPEIILLLMPGDAPLKSIDEDERLADFRGLDIPAVKNGKIVLINDPLTLLPTTTLPRIAAHMAKAIHPDRTVVIDKALEASIDESPATQPATTTQPTTAPDVAPTQPEPAVEH